MAFIHRKLLPEPNSDQTTDCSDCAYPQFYWPPEPPPLPPSSTTEISPFLIVIVAVIGSAVLFIGYYLIMIRYCTRFRRSPVHEQAEDFMNEDHGLEIDHPIWYIATVGLQPAMINSISVVKFKKGHNLIKGADCSVCLSQFQDDELVRLLPKCNHAFHISCIDTWLRSHTNCPLCRAAIVPTASNTVSGPVDQNRNHGFGLNQNTQMENAENNGDLGSNCEICENSGETGESLDSKSEIETVIIVTRSLSMGSAAESVVTESNSGDSTVDLQSLNSLNDSRTRRMMMRSFSCGGNV